MATRQWIEAGNLGDAGTIEQVQGWLDIWPNAYVVVSAGRLDEIKKLKGDIIPGVKIGNTLRRLDDLERWPILHEKLKGYPVLAIECETIMEPVWRGEITIDWLAVANELSKLQVRELHWYPGTAPLPRSIFYWVAISMGAPNTRFLVNESWAPGQESWFEATKMLKSLIPTSAIPMLNCPAMNVEEAAKLSAVINDTHGESMLWTPPNERTTLLQRIVQNRVLE